jgi:hypothetical protein
MPMSLHPFQFGSRSAAFKSAPKGGRGGPCTGFPSLTAMGVFSRNFLVGIGVGSSDDGRCGPNTGFLSMKPMHAMMKDERQREIVRTIDNDLDAQIFLCVHGQMQSRQCGCVVE